MICFSTLQSSRASITVYAENATIIFGIYFTDDGFDRQKNRKVEKENVYFSNLYMFQN
jgi:hypothetical protein